MTTIEHDDAAPDRLCTCGHPLSGHEGDGGPCETSTGPLGLDGCQGFTPSPDYATADDVPEHTNSAVDSGTFVPGVTP